VVLEASGMIDIDYTGSRVLQQTIARLRNDGMVVALARLSAERAYKQAALTGLIETLGAEMAFRSVEDAVTALRPTAE
jgi:predicted xylose isomerase-like sugar epimerase